MRRLAVLLLGIVLPPLLFGCGGDESPTSPSEPPEPEPRLEQIEVTPSSVSLTAEGDTAHFEAKALDQNGNELTDVSFSWNSSEPSVATINDEGVATAKASGTTQVEARAEGVTGTASLDVSIERRRVTGTVTAPEEENLSFSASDLSVASADETAPVEEDGSFVITTDEEDDPSTLFLGTESSEVSLLLFSFSDTDSLEVNLDAVAQSVAATHPALAGAPTEVRRDVYESAPSQPSFDALRSHIRNTLQGGTNLYADVELWNRALSVVEDVTGVQTATGAGDRSKADAVAVRERDIEDPNLTKDVSSQVWSVTNPRPVFWGFQTQAVDSDASVQTVVQPAELEWKLSELWWVLTATETEHGQIDPGLHNGTLTRGFTTNPEVLGSEANILALAGNVLEVWSLGSEAFDVPIPLNRGCAETVLQEARDVDSQLWGAVRNLALGLDISVADAFKDLIREFLEAYVASGCVRENVAQKLASEGVERLAGSIFATIDAVLRADEAFQLGRVLRGLTRDAFASELALRDISDAGGQWTQFTAVSLQSDPSGAEIFVDGEKTGTTPQYLINLRDERSEGAHDYRLDKAGFQAVSGTFTVDWGRWTRVDASLEETKGGDLEVSTTTSGEDQDTDGYTVTVDGSQPTEIDPNGSTTFTDLSPGEHEVELSDIESNCSVEGQNPKRVEVMASETATASFAVNCSGQTGTLEVGAFTAGQNQDSDGYTVTVDGTLTAEIDPNGSTTFTDLSVGDHEVELSAIRPNCTTASQNPRTVEVEANETASLNFSVSCTTEPGALEVSASTSGEDPDTDGYTVTIDGTQPASIGPNGSTTFTGLSAGQHSVQLSDIKLNCSVDGSNPKTVDVIGGETRSVSFSLSCTSETGDLEISVSTSGQDPDSDGYTVLLDESESGSIDANGSTTLTGVSVGEHEVGLSGLQSNCSVDGNNPQTVNVPPGDAESVNFSVSCSSQAGGLLAYYPLNGDVSDVSGNEKDGTINGDPSFGSGRDGQALALDGQDDYVELPSVGFGEGSFTIAGWVNLDSFSTPNTLYSNGEGTPACDDGIRRFGTSGDGRVQLRVANCEDQQGTTPTTLSTGQWYHIAITVDKSSATARIYIDGNQDTSFSVAGLFDDLISSAPHALGVFVQADGPNKAGWFDGRMDEVRFYGRALSTSEIESLAQ